MGLTENLSECFMQCNCNYTTLQHSFNIRLYNFSDQLLKRTIILQAEHIPELSLLVSLLVSARETSQRNMIGLIPVNREHKI